MARKERNQTFQLEDWIEIDGVIFRVRKAGITAIRVSARRADGKAIDTFEKHSHNGRTGTSQSRRRA